MYHYFIPFYGWIIFHCLYMWHFVYPFILWWTLGLFPPFGYCEYCRYEDVWNVFAWIPVLNYFGCTLRSGIAGSYDNSIFNFLRNYQIVFHHFTFPPAMYEGSKFFKCSPTLVIIFKRIFFIKKFFIIAILVQVKWYLIVVLICISLMGIDASFHVLIGCLYIFFGEMSGSLLIFIYLFYLFKNIFIYLFWLCRVLVAARGIF